MPSRRPTSASGKTYLVHCCSMLATGHRAPAIALGRSEEETEKRLSALLLDGSPIILLDNVSGPLRGDFLCLAIEQQRIKIRLLGHSETVTVETNSAIYSTGNNLVISGDVVRRAIRGELDPGVEKPWQRAFETQAARNDRRRPREVHRRRADDLPGFPGVRRGDGAAGTSFLRAMVGPGPVGACVAWRIRSRRQHRNVIRKRSRARKRGGGGRDVGTDDRAGRHQRKPDPENRGRSRRDGELARHGHSRKSGFPPGADGRRKGARRVGCRPPRDWDTGSGCIETSASTDGHSAAAKRTGQGTCGGSNWREEAKIVRTYFSQRGKSVRGKMTDTFSNGAETTSRSSPTSHIGKERTDGND